MAAVSSDVVLSPIEAARMAAVIEETLEKLSLLTAISPDILMHRDEVAEMTSGEISRLITEQRALEAKYESLVAARAMMKGAGNKSRLKDLQTEIQTVSYQLRESMKGLCRSLRESPDVGDSISRILEEREALALLLEKTLTDLRDGHFSALSTFVDRENAARQKMRAVASQEEEVLKEVERLTSVLKEEDEKHALDMESKRKELEELKEKLRKLKVDTTLTLRYARKEAAAKTESMSRAYTAEEAELMRNIEELRKKAEVEAFVHEQTMDVLKKEQDEYTKLLDEWRLKYSTELEAKETELRNLTAEREKQKALLEALQQRYDKDLADLAAQEAEEAAAREDEAAAKAEEERRKVAATQIQNVIGDMFAMVLAAANSAKDAKKAKGKGGKDAKKK